MKKSFLIILVILVSGLAENVLAQNVNLSADSAKTLLSKNKWAVDYALMQGVKIGSPFKVTYSFNTDNTLIFTDQGHSLNGQWIYDEKGKKIRLVLNGVNRLSISQLTDKSITLTPEKGRLGEDAPPMTMILKPVKE